MQASHLASASCETSDSGCEDIVGAYSAAGGYDSQWCDVAKHPDSSNGTQVPYLLQTDRWDVDMSMPSWMSACASSAGSCYQIALVACSARGGFAPVQHAHTHWPALSNYVPMRAGVPVDYNLPQDEQRQGR
jgi:hypothetical protein